MKNVLTAVKEKNLLQEDELYLNLSLAAGNVNLLKRLIDYYSSHAYCYIRETFNSCLPHPKDLIP